jgi:maltose O-acetyltransferase
MKSHIISMLGGFLYGFTNYFVAYIPCWIVRKRLYQLLGMKIGKHSRIMMRTTITIPWRIQIGENTYINEFSYLDGRGG